MSLQLRLRHIFDASTGGVVTGNRRYVARSLTGGSGWGVYDKMTQRFLSNADVRLIADVDEVIPQH